MSSGIINWPWRGEWPNSACIHRNAQEGPLAKGASNIGAFFLTSTVEKTGKKSLQVKPRMCTIWLHTDSATTAPTVLLSSKVPLFHDSNVAKNESWDDYTIHVLGPKTGIFWMICPRSKVSPCISQWPVTPQTREIETCFQCEWDNSLSECECSASYMSLMKTVMNL